MTKGDVDAEVIWCKVYRNPKIELLVGAIYRPELGGEQTLDRICNSLNAVDTDNSIIVGDFNFRDINWDLCEAPSALSKKFLSCIEDNLLFQLVEKPTRGKNILDMLLTGNPDIVHSVDVGEKLGASDHCSILAQLMIPVPRIALSNRKIYLYSKGDYEAYSDAVKTTKWSNVFTGKNLMTNGTLCKQNTTDGERNHPE